MTTKVRIIEAAAALLDSGGEGAVTLRAVGLASGISHNAPYKHFKDKSALLAAVATCEFIALNESFAAASQGRVRPLTKLKRALHAFVVYGRDFPARYRLLFSNPEIATQGGDLEAAAMNLFITFAAIVSECQETSQLPQIPALPLSGLIFASVHGLIDLQVGGRMRSEKGFTGVIEGVNLLIEILSHSQP